MSLHLYYSRITSNLCQFVCLLKLSVVDQQMQEVLHINQEQDQLNQKDSFLLVVVANASSNQEHNQAVCPKQTQKNSEFS